MAEFVTKAENKRRLAIIILCAIVNVGEMNTHTRASITARLIVVFTFFLSLVYRDLYPASRAQPKVVRRHAG